jgi:hypothetical protein
MINPFQKDDSNEIVSEIKKENSTYNVQGLIFVT